MTEFTAWVHGAHTVQPDGKRVVVLAKTDYPLITTTKLLAELLVDPRYTMRSIVLTNKEGDVVSQASAFQQLAG